MHHLGGYAHGGAVGGQVAQHHAACADAGVISDEHRARHLGAGADEHVVAQGGVALAGILAGTAQRYPVVDGAVVSDLAGLAEHDAHAVVDEQTLADGGTRVDLNAGAVAAMLADPPCQKKCLCPYSQCAMRWYTRMWNPGYSSITSSTLRAAESLRWMFRASSSKPMRKTSLPINTPPTRRGSPFYRIIIAQHTFSLIVLATESMVTGFVVATP